MNATTPFEASLVDSQDMLERAIASGQLSDALTRQAQTILARLGQPLRLSVLGLAGAGKSTLMNLLLGADVFTPGHPMPTLSLRYGAASVAKCTLANGDVQTLRDTDFATIASLHPAFVDMTMPLAALQKLSMMEVVAGDNPAEMQRAVHWAGKRTDIALWCTQTCTPDEQALWAMLPDHVLDHSFLVLTKADQMNDLGTLSERLGRAHDIGGDSFRQILSLATEDALRARQPDGSVNKDALRASGGVALISAILREVETGRRAAADAAEVFLRQIDFDPAQAPAAIEETPAPAVQSAVEAAAEPEAPVAPAPAVTVEVEQPVEPTPKEVAEPTAAEPSPPAKIAVLPEPVTDPEPAPAVAPVIAAPAAPPSAPRTKIGPDARAACETVLEQLSAEGAALAHQLETGEIAPETVMDVSVDTVIWLADYLADSAAADDPALATALAATTDAADLIQLIQLEQGENIASDALGLMIQLKHEIQAELVA